MMQWLHAPHHSRICSLHLFQHEKGIILKATNLDPQACTQGQKTAALESPDQSLICLIKLDRNKA